MNDWTRCELAKIQFTVLLEMVPNSFEEVVFDSPSPLGFRADLVADRAGYTATVTYLCQIGLAPSLMQFQQNGEGTFNWRLKVRVPQAWELPATPLLPHVNPES